MSFTSCSVYGRSAQFGKLSAITGVLCERCCSLSLSGDLRDLLIRGVHRLVRYCNFCTKYRKIVTSAKHMLRCSPTQALWLTLHKASATNYLTCHMRPTAARTRQSPEFHATHYPLFQQLAPVHFALAHTAHKKMADAAVAKAKRNVPRESAIPTEVIHSIVSYLVASFIDDLFEGTLALSVDMDSQIGKDEVCSCIRTAQRDAHEF